MQLSIIVAASANGAIGKNNQLPWHLPQDLKYFKQVTMGKPIIMGRKTYESIGRPLPGRKNIVITRNRDWCADGVIVVNSLSQAYDEIECDAEAFVIGGAEIYSSALPLVDKIYLTRINLNVDGDAFLPLISIADWRLVSKTDGDLSAPLPHQFLIYERIKRK